jgi:23S rRNA pseudouridine1911/1915/1917 synthase
LTIAKRHAPSGTTSLLPLPPPPPHQTPFQLRTAPGQQRERIDRFLQQTLPSISRHKVHELIDSGLVRINGQIPKKSYRVGPDEAIEIYFRDQTVYDILPEPIPLEIAYEDEFLLVVNKPAGMVTHPAHGHFSGTLVNALMYHFGLPPLVPSPLSQAGPDQSTPALPDPDDEGVEPASFIPQDSSFFSSSIRPGIVHRLDKGTSGLLVVAKNEIIHRKLTEQFSAREVRREYLALVWGRFKLNEGTIDAPLGRHPGDRKRFAVLRRGGKEAITTYRVLETYRETTLLAIRLKTGRTHQIRVHLESQAHPVFGDADYGGRHKRLTNLSGSRRHFYESLLAGIPEFALHARELGFVHPVTGEFMSWEQPLPSYLSKLLDFLREDVTKNLDID